MQLINIPHDGMAVCHTTRGAKRGALLFGGEQAARNVPEAEQRPLALYEDAMTHIWNITSQAYTEGYNHVL